MRKTIFGFNQQKAVQLGLTTDDLLLLNYIEFAQNSHKMLHKEVDGISYVYLSHKHIREDLPILSWSEGTLKNRVLRLKQLNIIASVCDKNGSGTRTYYTLTEFAQTTLFEDLMYTDNQDDNSDVTPELRQTSLQNDVRRHSKMTSYNKLVDSNIENNNTILKNSTGDLYNNINNEDILEEVPKRRILMNDDFSEKGYNDDKKENKRVSLYQKCMDAIDEYTSDELLREKLKEYLPIRLKIKSKDANDKRDSYKINGVAQWKAILRKLDLIEAKDRIDSVQQSIDRNYASFFEVHKYTNNNFKKQDVFAESYGVKSVRPEEVEGGESSGIIF